MTRLLQHYRLMRVLSILILSLFLLSGCSKPPSKVVGSLVKENHTPKKYKKLAVLAFMQTLEGRILMENAIADNMRANLISGVPTYEVFPFVSDPEAMDVLTADMTEEELEQSVIAAIKRENIDALMIVTILDVQQTDRYIPSSGYSGYYYMPGYDPVYTYTYHGYFSYAYTSSRRPGYYERDSKYFLESNLYDTEGDGLIWTGQTLTKDPRSIREEIGKVAELITNQLISKNVVISGLGVN